MNVNPATNQNDAESASVVLPVFSPTDGPGSGRFGYCRNPGCTSCVARASKADSWRLTLAAQAAELRKLAADVGRASLDREPDSLTARILRVAQYVAETADSMGRATSVEVKS